MPSAATPAHAAPRTSAPAPPRSVRDPSTAPAPPRSERVVPAPSRTAREPLAASAQTRPARDAAVPPSSARDAPTAPRAARDAPRASPSAARVTQRSTSQLTPPFDAAAPSHTFLRPAVLPALSRSAHDVPRSAAIAALKAPCPAPGSSRAAFSHAVPALSSAAPALKAPTPSSQQKPSMRSPRFPAPQPNPPIPVGRFPSPPQRAEKRNMPSISPGSPMDTAHTAPVAPTYAHTVRTPPGSTSTSATTAVTSGVSPIAAAEPTNTSTAATHTEIPAPAPTLPKTPSRYPPLIVEALPDWTTHFKELKRLLGHTPNGRPFGKGVRFLPRSDEEFRTIQRYLTQLESENGISWFCYSLPAERSIKVAIRGLPANTEPALVEQELRELGYVPEHVRTIPPRAGRPGCLMFAQLQRTPGLIPGIYEVRELLCMPGIIVESWRGRKGPAQCHRCQQFRHSSHNCHRPIACVRCGENHPARECQRPLEDPPTCANCGGAHTANNAACPVFKRESRNRRAGTVARTSTTMRATTFTTHTAATEADAPGSLMAAANQPGQQPGGKRRRKRGKRAGARKDEPSQAPSTAPYETAGRCSTAPPGQSKPTVVAAPERGTKAKRVAPQSAPQPESGHLDPRFAAVISTLNQRRVDIGLINETHLKPVDKLKVPGYHVYREDHISPNGIAYRGLAVLVRRNVIHQVLPVPQLQTSYALGVEVCIDGQPTRLFAFYKPPQHRIAVVDVHALLDSPLPTIVAGDFNAKHTAWNSNTVCPDGRRLLDDADRHSYKVLGPEVPTHYPYCAAHTPDVIDLAVVRGLTAAPSLDVMDDHLVSNHQAVLLTLESIPTTMIPPSPKHRQDWRVFAAHMAEHSPSYRVETSTDVDRLASDFSTSLSTALRESRLDAEPSRRPPQLRPYLQAMIEEKRKLRRKWQTRRCPIMRSQLNALAAKISEALENDATESWSVLKIIKVRKSLKYVRI
ncbi:striated muscle-specific serine/threonine-protein kinase-like [Bicyclus anynana]|uniref:Striated muscle-specific serine/threonine-protein kinase-like n=1 Tax=Bicyclus anynana TaxID=110368 RepID=A0ABM3LR40_BICAN|nr:striated muscle-specific serine/threonine-protein kinase-like [Bicyclus anynana]